MVIYASGKGIDRIVGHLLAQILKCSNGVLGISATENHGILIVTLWVLGSEIDGLLIVLRSATGIVVGYANVALQKECAGIL